MKRTFLVISIIVLFFSFSASNAQDGPWVAPDSAKEIKNKVSENKRAASAKKGAKVFTARCVFCHGKEAKGDGPAGARLVPKPANLTSSRVQDQADGEIFWKITNGRGPMPKWEAILSEEERWNLVNFINTLGE
ncbi:c-type cytochrome [uncultured Croceitalea sp.]|uniref:c-type cytochrome n=1 Tax=uncultured Croceitalea sp. TaxID=1798908 RepID=UPI00374FB1FF